MSDTIRTRFRALGAEMKGFRLNVLAPHCTSSRAAAVPLIGAIYYALGLQGDYTEAQALAANIEAVHEGRDNTVYVVVHTPVSDEEQDNLLQGLAEVCDIAPEKVHIVAPDSHEWIGNKPK